jgi:hypothetical protein
MMKSIVVPDGSVLLDTDGKITAAHIAAIKAYRYKGTPVAGIIRYVSLYQVSTGFDIDPAEAQLLLDNFEILGLVQHCLQAATGSTGWTASVALGGVKGAIAKKHADLVGYPTDSMVAYDDEDVADGDIAGEIGAWVANLGRPPLLYTGFQPGLTPQQLWELPSVHCYWGAAGDWTVAECGVAMRQQYPSVNIGGVLFDVNVASADQKGRRVVFATSA